uniref:Putative LAGLIDADG homing endonuclease n=1 Tax=Coleochaete scutata TaxID=3125 RepID=A0A5P9NWM3_COLSC|nr:putative LAGLIDADG homing endonuclease [Coleochaete scutata]QFU80124.1 putative LAGLIDADG homing endonuclease [Coleochaete scutata]
MNKINDMSWDWLAGFVDGEGSFHVSIRKSASLNPTIDRRFAIAQSSKDRDLLVKIQQFLDAGTVTKANKQGVCHLVIYNATKLSHILTNLVPRLQSIKKHKAVLFLEINELCRKKVHLLGDLNLIKDRISEFYGKLNPGQSTNNEPLSPDWIRGFVEAEGCFGVSFHKRERGYKHQIRVRFTIGLHSRDRLLLIRINNFFLVGHVTVHFQSEPKIALGEHDSVFQTGSYQYSVESIKSINEKIIPFFEEKSFHGIKKHSFELMSKVARILKDKLHLTPEGRNLIETMVKDYRAN